MFITNAQYENDLEGNVLLIKATIDGQQLFVSLDPNNRHFQAIQEWVAEGNTIAEAE